jgi:hypothetical protein
VKASLKRMKRNKELWDDICDANKNDDEMEDRALHKMGKRGRGGLTVSRRDPGSGSPPRQGGNWVSISQHRWRYFQQHW